MEEDADAQGVGEQRRTLGLRRRTLAVRRWSYDAGAEEEDGVRCWRLGGWSTTLAPRRTTKYDAGTEEAEDGRERWR